MTDELTRACEELVDYCGAAVDATPVGGFYVPLRILQRVAKAVETQHRARVREIEVRR